MTGDEASMDAEGELQSQQATLQGNKAPSQYSALTSKPNHERCVHFHSQYMSRIYFNNMDSLFRACKLQRQTVSVAFQRQPKSVWWYSNVKFSGDFRGEHGELRALKSGNNDWMQLTQLTTSTSMNPAFFFRVLAQGWKNKKQNCAQHGLKSPKSLTDDSRGKGGWVGGFNVFPRIWHSSSFQMLYFKVQGL